MSTKTIAFTGKRRIYDYNYQDVRYRKLIELLYQILNNEILYNDAKYFISGGALGFDTIAFHVVKSLKEGHDYIKNILAVPFKYQYIKWTKSDIDRYYLMRQTADMVVEVDRLPDYQNIYVPIGSYHVAKMQKRNEFMVNNCDMLIACWDYVKSGGTYNCIKYAVKQNKPILVINSNTLECKIYNTKEENK